MEPESMTVAELNQAVKDLREANYQLSLRAQKAEEHVTELDNFFLAEKDERTTLLRAFEGVCKVLSKECLGFHVREISKENQWALKYTLGQGWMVVCGLGGVGAAMTRYNGYVKDTWSMMIALEMVSLAMRGGWGGSAKVSNLRNTVEQVYLQLTDEDRREDHWKSKVCAALATIQVLCPEIADINNSA